MTKRQQRLARKRAQRVPIAGGSYTSQKRARLHQLAERASLGPDGSLVFDGRVWTHSEVDVLDGRAFHWQKGISGGMTVWKGRAGRVMAKAA